MTTHFRDSLVKRREERRWMGVARKRGGQDAFGKHLSGHTLWRPRYMSAQLSAISSSISAPPSSNSSPAIALLYDSCDVSSSTLTKVPSLQLSPPFPAHTPTHVSRIFRRIQGGPMHKCIDGNNMHYPSTQVACSTNAYSHPYRVTDGGLGLLVQREVL